MKACARTLPPFPKPSFFADSPELVGRGSGRLVLFGGRGAARSRCNAAPVTCDPQWRDLEDYMLPTQLWAQVL